jgi:signal peptidase II
MSDAARWCELEATVSSGLATDQADSVELSQGRGRPFRAILALTVAAVLAADQLSKLYIRSHFQLYSVLPIIRNWLDVTYTLNPGAAFSLFATMPAEFRHVFFIVLSTIAIVVLVALLARRSTPFTSGIAFALILGGTVGNLIDRLARGNVVDFIYFHHNSFSYPVFNIADSAITIGVAIILIFTTFSGSAGGQSAASGRV